MSVKSHLTSGASVHLSHTQRATEVKKFVGFSLKQLRCRDPALPRLKAMYSRLFCALQLTVFISLNETLNKVVFGIKHSY